MESSHANWLNFAYILEQALNLHLRRFALGVAQSVHNKLSRSMGDPKQFVEAFKSLHIYKRAPVMANVVSECIANEWDVAKLFVAQFKGEEASVRKQKSASHIDSDVSVVLNFLEYCKESKVKTEAKNLRTSRNRWAHFGRELSLSKKEFTDTQTSLEKLLLAIGVSPDDVTHLLSLGDAPLRRDLVAAALRGVPTADANQAELRTLLQLAEKNEKYVFDKDVLERLTVIQKRLLTIERRKGACNPLNYDDKDAVLDDDDFVNTDDLVDELESRRRDKQFFWLYGDHGTGKTTLAARLYAMHSQKGGNEQVTVRHHFAAGDKERCSAPNALRSLCDQLCDRVAGFQTALLDATQSSATCEESDFSWAAETTVNDISKHFRCLVQQPLTSVLESSDAPSLILIILDGLDECTNVEDRDKLCQLLTDPESMLQKVHVVFTATCEPVGKCAEAMCVVSLHELSQHRTLLVDFANHRLDLALGPSTSDQEQPATSGTLLSPHAPSIPTTIVPPSPTPLPPFASPSVAASANVTAQSDLPQASSTPSLADSATGVTRISILDKILKRSENSFHYLTLLPNSGGLSLSDLDAQLPFNFSDALFEYVARAFATLSSNEEPGLNRSLGRLLQLFAYFQSPCVRVEPLERILTCEHLDEFGDFDLASLLHVVPDLFYHDTVNKLLRVRQLPMLHWLVKDAISYARTTPKSLLGKRSHGWQTALSRALAGMATSEFEKLVNRMIRSAYELDQGGDGRSDVAQLSSRDAQTRHQSHLRFLVASHFDTNRLELNTAFDRARRSFVLICLSRDPSIPGPYLREPFLALAVEMCHDPFQNVNAFLKGIPHAVKGRLCTGLGDFDVAALIRAAVKHGHKEAAESIAKTMAEDWSIPQQKCTITALMYLHRKNCSKLQGEYAKLLLDHPDREMRPSSRSLGTLLDAYNSLPIPRFEKAIKEFKKYEAQWKAHPELLDQPDGFVWGQLIRAYVMSGKLDVAIRLYESHGVSERAFSLLYICRHLCATDPPQTRKSVKLLRDGVEEKELREKLEKSPHIDHLIRLIKMQCQSLLTYDESDYQLVSLVDSLCIVSQRVLLMNQQCSCDQLRLIAALLAAAYAFHDRVGVLDAFNEKQSLRRLIRDDRSLITRDAVALFNRYSRQRQRKKWFKTARRERGPGISTQFQAVYGSGSVDSANFEPSRTQFKQDYSKKAGREFLHSRDK